MPELPEVETVRRDLARLVTGATITGARLLCPAMLVGGGLRVFRKRIEGAAIAQVARHGKVLVLRLSSGSSLLIHFRMTGQLYVVGQAASLSGAATGWLPVLPGEVTVPRHTRSVFTLADGRCLLHVDVRRLGTLEVVPTEQEAESVTLSRVGPDALTQPPSPSHFMALLSRRACAIKTFLMDQSAIAGIGNIYACEILARAHIAPDVPCNALSPQQARELLRQTKRVLTEAVEAGGTTISDYRSGTGAEGWFQVRLRAYGREGEPCLQRGCHGTIQRIVQAQRSTYYCPCCQRLHGE